MRLPIINGLIRRRLLVNFRVDAEVMDRFLPPPFRPKLHRGCAIAGICLIRLERIRPEWLPGFCGISSENAAHRIAVLWDGPSGEPGGGVFIPRRDTGSRLNHFAGGRIFPGEHHLADFAVTDDGSRISISARARDGRMAVQLRARESGSLPDSSWFESLAESSAYFEGGSVGYSVTRDCRRLDGIQLQTEGWQVRPLAVEHVESSLFAGESAFPAGSVTFDHALIMRDLSHQWCEEPDMIRPGICGHENTKDEFFDLTFRNRRESDDNTNYRFSRVEEMGRAVAPEDAPGPLHHQRPVQGIEPADRSMISLFAQLCSTILQFPTCMRHHPD